MDTNKITPASEWKKGRLGQIVTLPSGKVVKVRTTFDLLSLISEGFVPNEVASLFTDQIRGGKELKREEIDAPMVANMQILMRHAICASVIEPTFCMVPEGEDPKSWEPEGEDEVSVMDLAMADLNFIYSVVQGGTTEASQFLKQKAERVEAMADEQDMELPPVKSSKGPKGRR